MISDKHQLALIIAGIADLLASGEEIKRPAEPDFTDINMLPTYGIRREKTHPQNPRQHRQKRKKK